MSGIVVLGSANMDLVVRQPRPARPGETMSGSSFATGPGGKGLNQAVAAARAGADVAFIGCVGADDFGARLTRVLDEAGIDASGVRVITEPADRASTGIAAISVTDDGENSIVVVPGANGDDELTETDAAAIARAQFLVVQLERPLPLVRRALEAARERGVRTVLTPAPATADAAALIPLADIVVPNEGEAALLSGLVDHDADASARALSGRASGGDGTGLAVVTLGERGAIVACGGEIVHRVGARRVDAVDTTGAGDTFVGALVAWLARGADLEEALEAATAAAAIAVTREGAAASMPSRDEIEAALAGEASVPDAAPQPVERAPDLIPAPVYLDTDLGIDDALALGYLLAHPGVEVVGVGSVHGNLDAPQAARNVLDLLALTAGRGIPVAVGASDPLAAPYAGGAPHVHGDNGIGGVVLDRSPDEPVSGDAADLLIRLAHEHAGRLRVVAIGPLTNLAIALERDPAIAGLVDGVWVMGGAALVPGNITPTGEANIFHDPEAAQVVLEAGWPVVLVPLDVTMQNRFTSADRAALSAAPGAATRAIGEMLALYEEFYTPIFGAPDVALHDPLAAALAAGGVRTALAPRVRVVVDTTDGPGRGQTICDFRGMYRGHPVPSGRSVEVVLELTEPFAPKLRARLLELR
ncbi:PfkB family carbohydrate kinase [Microbacterium sp. 1P10UB]|uniref:PfkB family carbohydrate kinase n=1 Tax=unclassified Microbacterium TaxID=2609290 RepID=UPI0039A15916